MSLRHALRIAFALVARSIASPAGAPIPSSLEARLTSSRTSSPSSTPILTASIDLNHTTITSVPGAWRTRCNELSGLPCIVYCSATDTACQATGAALASACAPEWNSYWDVSRGFEPAGPGWHSVTTAVGEPARVVSTTVASYTSFSTARETFVKQGEAGGETTLTPVYALGAPVMVPTVTTLPDNRTTYTVLEGLAPSCSVLSVSVMNREGCGKCTITGGTVDLYFWPATTSGGTASDGAPLSTVLDGSTLLSPTAYIHLRTAFAADSCSVVGAQHTGTLLAVDPAALSTQIHVGGKVAAYEYGKLDYADLTGLPPASQYQMQPSCVMFGCPTMYSTTWFPTLKVPPQVRSIDPAWADCVLGLEGLYDPPVALQPRAAAASPTRPTEPKPTPASPSTTQRHVSATPRHSQTGTAGPRPSIDDPDRSGSTSTATITATAQIIASTRVISIDYPDSLEASFSSRYRASNAEAAATLSDGRDEVAPTELLNPTPLSNGDGVVVGDQTLSTGRAITFGDGKSKTTLSLQTQASGETLLAFGTSALLVIDPTGVLVPGPISDLHQLPNGGYAIGASTLKPGDVLTATEDDNQVTYSMFMRGSTTVFALGTTRTLAMLPKSTQAPQADGADLAFTQASDGNLVLNGTRLLPHKPVTIGSGSERTTLAITSVQSVPAIVIDGLTTERLAHPPISTSSALPRITHAPTTAPPSSSPAAVASEPLSTSAESTASVASEWLSLVASVAIFVVMLVN